jgi:hypothetical protein
MDFTTIDLSEIGAELGSHFNKRDLDAYTAQCNYCDCNVTQRDDECPECGKPVVWLNSKPWKFLHGDPKLRIRELEAVEPTSETGKRLCGACKVMGFANLKEDADWAKAERNYGQAEMLSIIGYATQAKRGRGAMSHALAIARKKLREQPKSAQKPNGTIVVSSWEGV